MKVKDKRLKANPTEFPTSSHWNDAVEIGAATSTRNDSFRRELFQQEDRCLIKSTCRSCGAVIVGSVAQSLVADEQRHLERCSANPAFPQAG